MLLYNDMWRPLIHNYFNLHKCNWLQIDTEHPQNGSGKLGLKLVAFCVLFSRWQTKPKMTIHGDLYYEGKEFETRLKEKKPGDLTEELRTALGMPTGPVSILPKQNICIWQKNSGQLLVCLQDQWVYCQSKIFVSDRRTQDSSWYAYRTSEYIAKAKYLYLTEELRTALGMPTGPVSILPKQNICIWQKNSGQLLVCLQDQWVYCQSKIFVSDRRTQDSSWYAYRTSEYIAKAKYLYLTEELRTALGMPTGPVSILPKQNICIWQKNSGQLLVCLQDQWVYCQSKVFVSDRRTQDSSWYAYRTSEYIAKAKYLYQEI